MYMDVLLDFIEEQWFLSPSNVISVIYITSGIDSGKSLKQ